MTITKEELRQIILKGIEIGDLPLDTQDKILEKLGENIIIRIMIAVLENLPEESRGEFDAISASGDETKIREFLKTRISNVDELIQKTIQTTIGEFKEMAGIK